MPGLITSGDNHAAVGCDVIVLAVEPKDTPEVCQELSACRDALFVSLAAGVTLASLKSGSAERRLARASSA